MYCNGRQSCKRRVRSIPVLSNPIQNRCTASASFYGFSLQGFRDETYLDWERGYKWRAHQEWQSVLNRKAYQSKLSQGKFLEIGSEAVKIESRTNLLFSFEKMAIRDALKSERGARAFAEGLYALLLRPREPPN